MIKLNLSDLQNKDIVNMIDGKKIGNIIDARFNVGTGVIEKLIIEELYRKDIIDFLLVRLFLKDSNKFNLNDRLSHIYSYHIKL